jgi:hypothetical protein
MERSGALLFSDKNMSKIIDLTGQKIGILTVAKRAKSRNGDTYWEGL